MIEWLPAQFTGGLESVDVQNLTLKTMNETFDAAAANIIPPQVAGLLASQTGLSDHTGWCPVDPLTFESTLQPGIHVIGDAANAGDMPKSAYVANSQAKACAFAIIAGLTGTDAPAPHLYNTCYTYLSGDDAVSDAISFNADTGVIKVSEIMMSNVGETKEARRQAVREANGWYDAFTHDVFG
jgi:NADH dehydrogenase FAD-containing subunit